MSLARREILKATLIGILVACAILGMIVLSAVLLKGEYTIDVDKFDSDIEWGESVSLEGIEIIDNRTLGFLSMPLTRDKVVSIDDTDEAGRKKIVFIHNNREFTVYFDVKYKVEFLSYGEIIDTQRVFGKDEIVPPVATPKTGYEFSHWDVDLSQELTGNVQVNAVFKEIEYPSLQGITATYGDTLGDITLPSNEYGQWQFIYPSDTPVGDAGRQSFSVRFAFFEDETYFKYSFVNVTVNKKQLEFTDVKDTFIYDGNEHFPTYSISEDVDVMVITSGSANTEAGVYEYSFEIVDQNYVGIYTGEYEIQKPTVTVKVSSATVTYPASVPTFTYEVEGFENVDLLGIKINAPAYASQAGVFEIGVTYTNNNVNYDIHNGTLTVLKGDLPVDTPEISVATFEDKLSDISFVGKYLGTWAWENPNQIINSMDKVTAYAIFTHDDPNLNPVKMAIEITGIQKKTLSFNITRSTFTYEPGVERGLIYEIVGGTNPDFDYNSLKVEGNYIPDSPAINAGTYRRTLVINDDRYEGSTTVELKIEKATPEIDFSAISFTTVWSEDLALRDFKFDDINEGLAWKNPGERISGAGEHSFAVIFTPADTANYVTVDGQITVKVEKAAVEVVGVLDEYIKTYDTLEYNIKNSGIYARYTNGALTIKYYKDGVEVDKIVNAGTYKLVITVAEGDNYLGTTIEKTVTVNRAENTQTVKTEQTATYLDGLGVLRLPLDNEGSWSWLETEIGNAGTKTFTAVYTPDENANYLPRTVSVEVTVLKKTVKAPSYTATLLYNGKLQSLGLADTALYTVIDGGGIVNGTYSATLTLVDPDNYTWESSELSSIALQYRIVSVENAWVVTPSISGWTYGDAPSVPNAQAKYGDYRVEYYDASMNLLASVPTNAGTYFARFISTDENCSTVTADVRFVIAKRTVTAIPTLSASTFVYTGSNQKPDVIGADLTLYSVTNNGGTNVGSYNVSLKLEDPANYKWADVSGDTKNLPYSITKADAVISGLTIGGWTYGQSANAPTATTTFGNLTYVYSTAADGEYTGAVPTAAGIYYVKARVANSSNYNGSESAPVSFTIAKADASITGLNATYTHTYNGSAFNVTGIGKSHGESNLVYKINGVEVTKISVTDAGTYSIEVILPESTNYEKATATATITVNKAETPDVVTTTQSATYLDKLSTLTLPTSTIGTWSWADANGNAIADPSAVTVGNAGTNTFYAVFTPSTTNYNSKEVEVTVNVAKKAIEIPTVGDKTYRGSNITSEYTVPADALYTITSDVGGTTVGSYSVTFTIKDEYKENYKWAGSDGKSASTSVTYNVTTATININTFILTVSKNAWNFGEAEAIETASKAESFGTVKIVYSTSQDGTYVSYEDLLAEHGTLVGTELRLNAGTYYVKAIVEAEDDSATPDWSYAETAYVSFTVERASSTINGIKTGADSYKYEFSFDNTNSFGVTNGITLSHTELTGPTFTYYLDGGKVDAIYAPGTYTVVVSAVETTNFDAVSDEFTVTVSKIANKDVVNDNILNQTAIYGQSTSVIKVPDHTTLDKDGKKTGYWQLDPAVTTLGNVGNDKEFKLIFTPNDPVHYSNREITVKVDVTKKEVTAPTLKNTSLDYTANRQYAEFKADFDSSLYEILSNVGGINVAEDYSVTLKLLDPANHKWKGESDDAVNKTLYYDIVKANVDTTLPTYSATYGDLLSGLVLPTAPEGKWIWVDSEGNVLASSTKVGNVGANTFYAKYVCEPVEDGTYNYNDSAVISVTVNVAKLGITPPTLNQVDFVYDTGINLVLSSYVGISETIDNRQGATDVGEYSVTVKLDGNYKWIGWTDENGSDIADYTISYTISKASAGDRPTLSDNEFVFGEELTLISSNKFYTVVDSRNGSLDVGDYILTITLDNNYKWSDGGVDVVELPYSITKAPVVLPGLAWTETTFNSGVQKPDLTNTTDDNLYTVVYIESKNAGNYCVTVTLKDNGKNHKWDDDVEDAARELDYVIKKNDVNTNIGSFTATFGDLISSVTLPTAPEGKWIWVDSEGNALASTTKVGNADSNTFYAKYVCDPAEGTTDVYNYNDSAVIPVNVDVARLGILKPTLTGNSFVFGDTISLGVSTVAGVYTVTDNRDGSTDVGKYALTVKLNDNYKWTDNGADETADLTLPYTITRKPIGNKPTTLAKNVFIYNETISFSISTTSFYTVTDNRTTTDVGNYSLTVSLGKNYKWNDTDDVSDYDISYSIIKAAIPVPDTSSWDFTFGDDINLGIATDEKYEISDNRGESKDAGSYTVTLTIKTEYRKNYRWSDDEENGTRTTWSKSYTVKSYEPKINVTIDGWTFGDEPKSPVITITNCPDFLNVDMISVSYVDENNNPVSIGRFTPIGSYKAVISLAATDDSATPNWISASDDCTFTIATREIPVPTVSATKPYDDGNHVGCGVLPTEFFSVNYSGNYTEAGGPYYVVFKLTYPQSSVWVIGTGDSATKTNEDQTRSYHISAEANGWLDNAQPNIGDVTFDPNGTVITVEGKLLHGGYTVKFYAASQYDSESKTFTGEPLMTATYDADGNLTEGSTPTNAGKYVALYESTDTNHDHESAIVDFEIFKKSVIAPTLGSSGTDYDGDLHYTTIVHNDPAWNSLDPLYGWTTTLAVLNGGVKNAGGYDVVITLTNPDNFEWAEAQNKANNSVTLTYTIDKATFTPSVSINGWEFNSSASSPTNSGIPEFVLKDAKFTYKHTYAGTPNGGVYTEYGTTAPDKAGTYTVTLTVTGTDNWEGATVTSQEFTIERKTVPDVQLGAIVYNGTSQGINITDPNLNVLYKIDSQVPSTNVSTTVSAVLILLDKNNYQWNGITTETITVSTIIGEADIIVNAPDIDNWTYEGDEQKPTPNFDESQEDFPDISSYVSYVFSTAPNGTYVSYIELLKDYGTAIDAETTLLNAGTYYVKAVVADTENWNGGTSAGYSTFIVAPYEVTLPEIDEDSFDLTYDGTEKDLGLVNESEGRYNVDNGTTTDAGNHSAILTLKNSNYVWVDGRTGYKYTYSVDTEDAKIVKIPFEIKKFEFTDTHVTLGGTTSKYTETINITSELQNTGLDSSVTVDVDLLYGVRVPTTYAITSENVEIRDDGYTYYWFDTIDELKAALGVSHLATDTYYVKTVIAASDNWDKFELIDEFEVIKMPLSTDIKQTLIPVYTGSPLENIGLEGDLYTVTYPNKTDAGTYEATLTLTDEAALNYEWDCTWPAGTTDEEKLSIKIEYTIEKAAASITATNPETTPFKNGSFDFSDLIGATTNNTDVAKLLADSNYQIKSYTKIGANRPEADTPEVIFNAGTYKILITLAETDNFKAAEAKEVTVVISKATTAISGLVGGTPDYTGNDFFASIKNATAVTVTDSVADAPAASSITWTVNGSVVGNDFTIINQSVYVIEASFAGDDNYEAATSATATLTVKYVETAIESITGIGGKSEYDGTGVVVEVTINHTFAVPVIKYYEKDETAVDGYRWLGEDASGNAILPTNAGDYKVVVTVANDTNENWTTREEKYFFSIGQKTITIGYVDEQLLSNLVYGNDNVSYDIVKNNLVLEGFVVINGNTVGILEGEEDDLVIYLTAQTGYPEEVKNAVDYKFVANFPGTRNYKAVVNQKVEFTVQRKPISVPTLTKSSFVFGETVSLETLFGTTTFVGYTPKIVSTTFNVGQNYEVTLTLDDNHKWDLGEGQYSTEVKTLYYNITAKGSSITVTNTEVNVDYKNDAYLPKDIIEVTASYTDAEVVYTITAYTKADGTVVSDLTGITLTDAGTYVVTVTLAHNDNYTDATAVPVTVNIVKIDDSSVKELVTTQEATYGDKLSTLTLPANSTIGTWSWKNADENTTVGNFGDNTFYAIFTPSNENLNNYNSKEIAVTVSVAQKVVNVTDVYNSVHKTYVYSGNSHTPSYMKDGKLTAYAVGVKFSAGYKVSAVVGGTNVADAMSVTFELLDANYKWSDTSNVVYGKYTVPLNITPAPNSWVDGDEPKLTYTNPEGFTDSTGNIYGGSFTVGSATYDTTYTQYRVQNSGAAYTDGLPSNRGTYEIVVYTKSVNATAISETFFVEIKPQPVEIPTSADLKPLTYNNGATLKAELAASSTLYSVDTSKAIGAGTTAGIEVSLWVKLNNTTNYVWSDGTTESKEVKTKIEKANVTLKDGSQTSIEGNKNSWTFTEIEAAGGLEVFTKAVVDEAFKEWDVSVELMFSYNDGDYVTYEELPRYVFNGTGYLEVGNYKVKTVIVGTTNYNGDETEPISFTITPKEVTEPSVDDLFYNGSERRPSCNGIDYYTESEGGSYEGFIVTELQSATNVGTDNIWIKVQLASKNYIWERSTEYTDEVKTLYGSIDPATVEIDSVTVNYGNTIYYGDTITIDHTLKTESFNTDHTTTVEFSTSKNGTWYTNITELYTNGSLYAGTYYVRVTVKDSSDVENWTADPKVESFTVKKASSAGLQASGVGAQYNHIFNGSPYEIDTTGIGIVDKETLVAITNAGDVEVSCNIIEFNSSTANLPVEIKNVGNYVVKFTISSENYEDVTETVPVVVSPQEITFSVSLGNWTYGNKADSPVITDLPSYVDYTITYSGTAKDGSSHSGESAPTKAGDYVITITPETSSNWTIKNANGNATCEFDILQATPVVDEQYKFSLSVLTGDAQKSYSGELYQNLLVALDNGTYYKGDAMSSNELVPGTYTISALNFAGSGSTCTLTYTQTANKNYVESVTIENVEVNLKIVAKVGGPVTDQTYVSGTTFGTIENAVAKANANGGGEVWVVADNTGYVQIKESIEIKNGVTLLLPYGNSNDANGRNQSGQSTSQVKDVAYGNTDDTGLVTKVTLLAGKSIIIYTGGTLEISGVLSGGGGGGAYAGQVGGNHARLVMGAKSSIICEGTIKCYGYIWEETLNNESSISMEKTSTIYMPLVVRDFKGGSLMYGLQYGFEDYEYSPFNQIQFINVHPTITYKYGSKCNTWANLCTSSLIGSGTQHNFTEGKLIGDKDSKAFIALTDSTYSSITAKYNSHTDIMDLHIYGGAKTNVLSLTLDVLSNEITVTSDKFVYGLSWLQKIYLHKATGQSTANYSMLQKYKMLPGSVLVVDSDVTLTVGTMAIYNGSSDETLGFGDLIKTCKYPDAYPSSVTDSEYKGKTIPSAKLIVNGNLIGSYIGGKVYTENDKGRATIKATTAYTVTYEATEYGGERTNTRITKHFVFTLPLELYSVDGTYLSGVQNNIEYHTENGKWIGTTGDAPTASRNNVATGVEVPSCITPDTLITLADGTQVRVDSLKGDEMLLVWNLETGTWDYAPIMFIDSESEAEYEVIYLTFSDGSVVKVIYEHGFWDYDLNKYVYLDANAAEYIGHYFAKQNGDELVKVQLVDVEIRTELTTAWSPVTVGHLCYFVNGMLSMPGGVGGLFNIFEVNEETMTYDYEAIAKDIETYGLFTYEELNAICPLSEEMFNAAGGAYLKISIGKGNLTMEELIAMINRYSVYFE